MPRSLLTILVFLSTLALTSACVKKVEGPAQVGPVSGGTGDGTGGGDLYNEQLRELREKLATAAQAVYEGTAGDAFCNPVNCPDSENPLCGLSQPQRNYCVTFLRRNTSALIERLHSFQISVSAVTTVLHGPDLSPVLMQTALSEIGPIRVSIPRLTAADLSPLQVSANLAHEFLHKVNDPLHGFTTDQGHYDVFSGPKIGADLLTGAGYALAVLAQRTETPAAALRFVNGTAHNFGQVIPQSAVPAASNTFFVLNEGASSATLAVTPPAAPFRMDSEDCSRPAGLAPGETCSMVIAYEPTDSGSHAGTLSVAHSSDQGVKTISMALSGRARIPAFFLGVGYASAGTGTTPNKSHVLSFDARNGSPLPSRWPTLAEDLSLDLKYGDIHIALADLDGDGINEGLVTNSRYDSKSLRGFDLVTGLVERLIAQVYGNFGGGSWVAAGDLDGDGRTDLVTGADASGGPHVRTWDPEGVRGGIFPYNTSFVGGVRVAAGDFNGDGKADVITAVGPGGGPHVKVLNAATFTTLFELFTFEGDYSAGLYVSAADTNADGRADIIVSSGDGSRVSVFCNNTWAPCQQSTAIYPADYTGGVITAAGDVDGDGKAEIIAAPRAAGTQPIKILKINGAGFTELSSINVPGIATANFLTVGFGY